MEIVHHSLFRVTRDTDYDVSDEADDLLLAVEEEVRRRRFGEVVRLEISPDMEPRLLDQLVEAMNIGAQQVFETPGLIGLDDLTDVYSRSGLPRAPLSALAGRHPAAVPAGEPDPPRGRRLLRDAPGRHPRPSPLRLLHELGRALRSQGGRGPERPRDQADGLSDERRLAAGPGADRGLGAGQAGGLPGGAQGALRRERQHRLGEGTGGGGGPRRLRHPRPEDPRQVRPGRTPGGRRSPQLRPHRDRQLQPEDRADLHRLRALHRQSGDRRRHRRDVQLPDRLRPPERVPQGAGCSVQPQGRHHRRDRAGDRGPIRREPGPDPDEDELAARRILHPGALSRLAGWGEGRAQCQGHLRASAGGARGLGEHPGRLDRRPLPRAFADLLLRASR